MIPFKSEIAALVTALCWSWTAIFFTAAGKRIGHTAVNILRLTGAVFLLFCATILLVGSDPLKWYEGGSISMLVISGVIGLALGDNALFNAMLKFGPRRATLVMACVPIMTSILGYLFLSERLSAPAWIGILLTVAGVAWVVFEKEPQKVYSEIPAGSIRSGLILGLVAALCQAIGLILSKSGMGETVTPVAATLLRMIAGWFGIAILLTFKREWNTIRTAWNDRQAMLLTGAGTIVGPFLGVWLSIVSVKYAETGIAATLMGTTPILIIPWSILIFKERVSPGAILGAVAAVIGTMLIFQR